VTDHPVLIKWMNCRLHEHESFDIVCTKMGISTLTEYLQALYIIPKIKYFLENVLTESGEKYIFALYMSLECFIKNNDLNYVQVDLQLEACGFSDNSIEQGCARCIDNSHYKAAMAEHLLGCRYFDKFQHIHENSQLTVTEGNNNLASTGLEIELDELVEKMYENSNKLADDGSLGNGLPPPTIKPMMKEKSNDSYILLPFINLLNDDIIMRWLSKVEAIEVSKICFFPLSHER
jgi:hypothetical protein